MSLPRHRALSLLQQCRGDEIWSVDACRDAGVPEDWINELADTFESGFRSDRQTIYVDDQVTNQYHGVRDIDLALRIAASLNIKTDAILAMSPTRESIVEAIKQAVLE